ncbi:MAG: phospholipase [Paludibacteraceae bacterium]|nr:phospholipase [Paludibacteraceae bacterium]
MNWIMVIVVAVLVILLSLAGIYIRKVNRETPESEVKTIPDDCCGAHAVCERDSLLTKTDDIIYFDDEELDTLAGIAPEEMTNQQLKMVEDVFFTLREQDVAGWIRSTQLRNIILPEDIREQALLIVSERRTSRLENFNKHE